MKELVRVLGLHYEFIKHTVESWKSLASFYPASLEHHHSVAGGLWEHSLSVALRMLERVERYFPIKDNESSVEYQRRLAKVKVYVCLCGLFHDAGKIAMYIPDTGGFLYNPLTLEQPKEIKGYTRSKISYRENYLSVLILGAILSRDRTFLESEYFNWEELNQVCEAILLEHSPLTTQNQYLALLRECDMEDVKVAMQESKEESLKSGDIYELAFEEFKKVVRSSSSGFDFFLFEDGTLGVVSPVITKDKFLKPFTARLGVSIDEFKLYEEWKQKGYILSEPVLTEIVIKDKVRKLHLLILEAGKVFSKEEQKLLSVFKKKPDGEDRKPVVEITL